MEKTKLFELNEFLSYTNEFLSDKMVNVIRTKVNDAIEEHTKICEEKIKISDIDKELLKKVHSLGDNPDVPLMENLQMKSIIKFIRKNYRNDQR